MKIELKGIKILQKASEETLCFEATIMIDGKQAGSVSNSGTGGANRYSDRKTQEALDAWGRTLPPLESKYGLALTQDSDLIIDQIVYDYDRRQALKKLMAKRIVFKESNGEITQTKALTTPVIQHYLSDDTAMAKLAKGSVVLNKLPFEEALRVFGSNAGRG